MKLWKGFNEKIRESKNQDSIKIIKQYEDDFDKTQNEVKTILKLSPQDIESNTTLLLSKKIIPDSIVTPSFWYYILYCAPCVCPYDRLASIRKAIPEIDKIIDTTNKIENFFSALLLKVEENNDSDKYTHIDAFVYAAEQSIPNLSKKQHI